MSTARVYCGSSEEAIREAISDDVDTLTIYGTGSNFTLSKEFIDIVLSLKATITTFNLEDIHTIGKEAFRYVKYVKSSDPTGLSITINADDTLKVIEPYAFAQTNILSTIDLPKSVKRIENCAFFDCQRLNRVRFEHEDNVSALEYIGMSAFQDCTSLEQIGRYDGEAEGYFPEGLKVIDAYAFARCSALTIVFRAPTTLETIGAYAFAWSGISGFSLQDGLNKRTGALPIYGELDAPADITLCSKRQFRYFHVDVTHEVNMIQLPDEFVTCVNDDQFMVFKNGRLIPHGSVISRPVDGTPLYKYEIYIDTPNAQEGDSLDIFYIPEILTNINDYAENFVQYKPPEDEIEGIIEDYTYLEPYKYLPADQKGFIKLNTPLYNFSNKNSMFIFVNGKKVDIDHIYDVSTSTMRITEYLQPIDIFNDEENKHYPIQLLNFEDNHKVNSFVFSKDGLSHSPDQVNIVPFECLESYNKLSILDKMLYNLPVDKLETLFPVNTSDMDEDDFIGVKYPRNDIILQRLYNINKEEGDDEWWRLLKV